MGLLVLIINSITSKPCYNHRTSLVLGSSISTTVSIARLGVHMQYLSHPHQQDPTNLSDAPAQCLGQS